MKALLPCADFWRAMLKKLVATAISVKVWLLTLVTALLLTGRLNEDNFTKLVMSLAAARIAVQGIKMWTGKAVTEVHNK